MSSTTYRLRATGGDVDRAVFLDTGEESEDPQLLAVSHVSLRHVQARPN